MKAGLGMGASSSRHRAIGCLALDLKAARESMPAANRPIAWEREESVVAHCVANTLENIYFHTLTGARRRAATPAVAGLDCMRVRRSAVRVAFSPEPPAHIPCCVGAVSGSTEQHDERAQCDEDKGGDLCSSASAENGDDDFADLLNSASWWPGANEYDVAGRTWPTLCGASGLGHQGRGTNAIANAQPSAIQRTKCALSAAGTHPQSSLYRNFLQQCTISRISQFDIYMLEY